MRRCDARCWPLAGSAARVPSVSPHRNVRRVITRARERARSGRTGHLRVRVACRESSRTVGRATTRLQNRDADEAEPRAASATAPRPALLLHCLAMT
jgi:hypothetical protein